MKNAIALFFVIAALTIFCCGCVKVETDKDKDLNINTATENSTVTTPSLPDETEPATTTEAEEEKPPVETETAATPEPEPEPEPEPDIRRVHIVCAGDNLIHSSIYNQAKRRAKSAGYDGYDFDFVYEKIEKYLEGADIAILNQETVVTDELPPSDYPRFCSPADLGEKMISLGFNVFSLSNNHVLDKDEEGLLYTLDFWDSHEGIIRYGAYRNEEDMQNIRTMEVNGITFAFLGYMEHTNGLKLPADSECKITYLKELATVESQVRRADEIADVVIVSPHYGKETINELTDSQIAYTDRLFEWGADIVIGTQPHTAQSCEYRDKPDGGKGFVYYCLGNFVSAQATYRTLVGLIGDLYVVKNMDTGEITIEDPKAIPIITQYGHNYSNIHIEPYATYTEELARAHGCSEHSMESIKKVLSYVPDEFLAIE